MVCHLPLSSLPWGTNTPCTCKVCKAPSLGPRHLVPAGAHSETFFFSAGSEAAQRSGLNQTSRTPVWLGRTSRCPTCGAFFSKLDVFMCNPLSLFLHVSPCMFNSSLVPLLRGHLFHNLSISHAANFFSLPCVHLCLPTPTPVVLWDAF